MTVQEFVGLLSGARSNGNGGWTATCPAHDDRVPSLSIAEGNDCRVLVRCQAGCTVEAVVAAVGIQMRDLFPSSSRVSNGGGPRRARPPSASPDTASSEPAGLTREQYAQAKCLPVEFLRGLGLSDVWYQNRQAVRVPFFDQGGVSAAEKEQLISSVASALHNLGGTKAESMQAAKANYRAGDDFDSLFKRALGHK